MSQKPSNLFLGYITSKEAGVRYGVTHDYIARLCRQGTIKCRLSGRAWHVQESSLTEIMGKRILEKNLQAKDLSHLRRSEYRLLAKKRKLSEVFFKKAATALFAIFLVFGSYTALVFTDLFVRTLVNAQDVVVRSLVSTASIINALPETLRGIVEGGDITLDGVSLEDASTGEFFCIKVVAGALTLVPGKCSDFTISDLSDKR